MSLNEVEKFDLIAQAAVKAKNDILETENPSYDEWKRETNENMMLFYVYGDMEKRKPCTVCKKLFEGETYQDRFPVAFVYSLIEHIARCGECYEYYRNRMDGKC